MSAKGQCWAHAPQQAVKTACETIVRQQTHILGTPASLEEPTTASEANIPVAILRVSNRVTRASDTSSDARLAGS